MWRPAIRGMEAVSGRPHRDRWVFRRIPVRHRRSPGIVKS